MHALIERPPSRRKYLPQIEIFPFSSSSCVYKKRPLHHRRCGRGMQRGSWEPKISNATKYLVLSSAFIRFLFVMTISSP